MRLKTLPFLASLCAIHASATVSFSQDEENALQEIEELPAFEATAQQNPVDLGMPTVSERLDEEDFEKINFINPEDALKYSPNINVRKRFIGDQNGVLSIRGNSVFQNARTLVFADGVNLTDLLFNRWNGSPKWQMISPDEVQSVEIYYGPYSAQFSGNSMNGVVNYFTKMPIEKESVVRASYFSQKYKAYGTDDQFNGYKGFASFGNRSGKFSYYGFYQRLENESQPQSFVRKLSPGAANGTETLVTGVFRDLDPKNRARAVLGAYGFNESRQDLFKFKGAYDFSDEVRGQFTLGYWDTSNDTNRVENYLRDGAGTMIWNGDVRYEGLTVNTQSRDWKVSQRDRQNLLFGSTLEGTMDDWNFQTYFTYYGILKDKTLTSDENPSDPAFDGSGRVKDFGDTGWFSYDFKIGQDEFAGNERLNAFAGLHYSAYEYEVNEFSSTDYANGLMDGARRNGDGGKTATPAIYAQADYQLADEWTLTLGARAEYWRASEGKDYSNGTTFHHAVRDEEDVSPKLSLSYDPGEEWETRLSMAKAVRYPLVSELFVGDPDTRSTVINNPTLKPAEVFAKTLIFERSLEDGSMRLAFFHNDETDTIFRQRADTLGGGSLTTFVNIDEVLTQGVEFSLQRAAVLSDALDVSFNASYNDTEIRKNAVDSSIVGNEIPRVPQWRVNLLATYHLSAQWDASIGFRHADGSFNELDNSDTNQDTYAGISSFNVWDFKTSYEPRDGLFLSAGIDNLFDEEYWMHHPFPHRTFFLDAKWSF